MWLLPCPGPVPSRGRKGVAPLPSAQGESFAPFSCFPNDRGKSPSCRPAAHPSYPNVASPPRPGSGAGPPARFPCTLQGAGSPCSLLLRQRLACGYPPPLPKKTLSAMSCFCIPDTYARSCQLRWRSASGQLKLILVVLCPRESSCGDGPTPSSPASAEMLRQEPGDESCCIPPSSPFVHRRRTTKRTLSETARRDERLTWGQEPAPEIQGRKIH